MEPVEKSLDQLLKEAKEVVAKMTSAEREEMHRQQRESWVRSETQWAKDFREGKCKRD